MRFEEGDEGQTVFAGRNQGIVQVYKTYCVCLQDRERYCHDPKNGIFLINSLKSDPCFISVFSARTDCSLWLEHPFHKFMECFRIWRIRPIRPFYLCVYYSQLQAPPRFPRNLFLITDNSQFVAKFMVKVTEEGEITLFLFFLFPSVV